MRGSMWQEGTYPAPGLLPEQWFLYFHHYINIVQYIDIAVSVPLRGRPNPYLVQQSGVELGTCRTSVQNSNHHTTWTPPPPLPSPPTPEN